MCTVKRGFTLYLRLRTHPVQTNMYMYTHTHTHVYTFTYNRWWHTQENVVFLSHRARVSFISRARDGNSICGVSKERQFFFPWFPLEINCFCFSHGTAGSGLFVLTISNNCSTSFDVSRRECLLMHHLMWAIGRDKKNYLSTWLQYFKAISLARPEKGGGNKAHFKA